MRREWPVYLTLLVLLVLLAGWVGIARFPQSAPAVAVERWPLVGRWIGELRRRYLPPEPPPAPAAGGEEDGGEAAAGAPRAAGVAPAERARTRSGPALPSPSLPPRDGSLWLAPGEALRARPEAGAEAVAEVDAFTEVTVLERAERWRRVRFGGREGWVFEPERAPGEPPLGRDPAPPRPLPATAPDPARLAAARGLLGAGAVESRLGPYLLASDADPRLTEFLARIAAAVEPAYVERYRQAPVGLPAEAVVVFAREADYRAFQQGEERLTTLPAGGHASGGLVALWAGERRRDDVAATLVHELTHLLNRRALGPALPPWLDEGLANDLAWGAIDADRALDPRRLGGAVERSGLEVTYHGPRAALRALAEAGGAGGLPRLSSLAALDWETFVRSPRRDQHYSLAGFFLRYLSSGDRGALAPALHAFLAAVAAGGPSDGAALVRHLGRSWDSLQWGFERWLSAVAAAEAGYVPGVETADDAEAVQRDDGGF